MAGDWIKMRSDLFTHPKVVRMASALKADTLRTVGGLMSAWCLFDAHSADGTLDGYTPATLDDHLRWPGFSAAMIAIRWLEVTVADGVESLTLPEFSTHNGQSAKRRAQDADRKKIVRKTSASKADTLRTREEKRREEIPTVGNSSTSAEIFEGTDDSARALVQMTIALRKMGMLDVHVQRPELIELAANGATVEQVAMTAAELALKAAGMFGDHELHPELLELFASGASAAQMLLTTEQHARLKNSAPKLGYLAGTLRGRARDTANGGNHAQGNGSGAAGRGGEPRSASGRAEAARRAGDAREAAHGIQDDGY